MTKNFNPEGRRSNIQFQSRASFFAPDRSMGPSGRGSPLGRAESSEVGPQEPYIEEVWLFK